MLRPPLHDACLLPLLISPDSPVPVDGGEARSTARQLSPGLMLCAEPASEFHFETLMECCRCNVAAVNFGSLLGGLEQLVV